MSITVYAKKNNKICVRANFSTGRSSHLVNSTFSASPYKYNATPPDHPRANRQAERFVDTFKRSLKNNRGKSRMKKRLQKSHKILTLDLALTLLGGARLIAWGAPFFVLVRHVWNKALQLDPPCATHVQSVGRTTNTDSVSKVSGRHWPGSHTVSHGSVRVWPAYGDSPSSRLTWIPGSQHKFFSSQNRSEYWEVSWRLEVTYCHSSSRERASTNIDVENSNE